MAISRHLHWLGILFQNLTEKIELTEVLRHAWRRDMPNNKKV